MNSLVDIAKRGLKSIDEIVNTAKITSLLELKRIGISSIDDLMTFGVTTAKDLPKLGIKNVDDFVEAGLGSLDDAHRVFKGASGAKPPKFRENFNKWDDMKNAHKGTVTQFVKDNKPLGATHPRDWLKNGGSLTIETFDDKTQIWKYTKGGITVPYVPKMVKEKMQNVVKFPDEYLYKVDGVFESSFKVPEGFTGNRTIDMKNAIKHLDNTYGIDEIPKGYILHHDIDNGVFQLVRADVHSGFSHYGGHYYNK